MTTENREPNPDLNARPRSVGPITHPSSAPPSQPASGMTREEGIDAIVSVASSPIRFWLGVVVATALSLPFGWILSYAAALPFFVGAFFFALLGLIIGATAYRVAKPAAPYARPTVLAGTTVIVLTGWLTTIIKEGRDFPIDAAKLVAERTRDLGDRSLSEFQKGVADEVGEYLAEHYAPGGTLGYVRWVLAGGEIRKGELDLARQPIRAPQTQWIWVVRVALSGGLLAFGVGSQTLLLAPKRVRSRTEWRP